MYVQHLLTILFLLVSFGPCFLSCLCLANSPSCYYMCLSCDSCPQLTKFFLSSSFLYLKSLTDQCCDTVHLQCCHLTLQFQVQALVTLPQNQSLLIANLFGKAEKMTQILEPLHPYGKLRWRFAWLFSVWFSSDCCESFGGSESVSRNFFLPLSLVFLPVTLPFS